MGTRPPAAYWNRRVLMNQLPLAGSLLEAVGLAHEEALFIAGFEHNIYALDRAHDAHVAVQKYLCFENIHVARAKAAEHLVKHLNRGFQPSRRKRRGIEPQGILGPVLGALRPCHRFTHLLDDRDDRCLVIFGVGR